MSENQARLERDLYDHEHDEPRASGGRRRRQVADWGVGDDVFEHMPRRRFSHATEGPPRERRAASRPDTPRPDTPRPDTLRPDTPRPDTLRPDTPRPDARRTIVIDPPDDLPSEIAAVTADRDLGDDPELEVSPPAPAERRTVVIGGRPEGSLEATRAQRRRPPRTARERVGNRPDRLAAWAVALGILLILIAVLTAL